MARPIKEGLDYFPLDCADSEGIRMTEAECGLTGYGVLIKLFQLVFRRRGYYLLWDAKTRILFNRDNNLEPGLTDRVVEKALEYEVFDRELYEQYSVLTSADIQLRYFEAVTKRSSVPVERQLLLVLPSNNIKFRIGPDSVFPQSEPMNPPKRASGA